MRSPSFSREAMNIMTDKENEKIKTLEGEVDRLQHIYDIKCDEYKELILINAKLRGRLADAKIDNED